MLSLNENKHYFKSSSFEGADGGFLQSGVTSIDLAL